MSRELQREALARGMSWARVIRGGLALLSVLLLLGATACGDTDNAARPNVLVIIVDDLGWGDVGYHGGDIPTPNIDRLVSEGIEFDRFYTQAVCTATRAGLLTGRSAIHFGLQYYPVTPEAHIGLSSREFGLAKAFAAADYSTAFIGKWHLGFAERKFLPNAHGFDRFYGHLMGGHDYFEHHYPAGGHDWQRDGVSVHESGYSTYLLGQEAIALIRGREDRPFFLMLSFNAPHVPIQAPVQVLRRFAHLRGEDRHTYTAVVAALDWTIGRVLKTLDEEGISEETIVLFLSDNGGFDHYASNAPLRGAKATLQEGGIRVLAALRWPGVLEAGKSEQFLSHLDVLPTLVAAAGIELSEKDAQRLDGRDMWPAIDSGVRIDREAFFFALDSPLANGDVHRAVIEAGEKLVQLSRADGSRVEELFDLLNDPGENRDLAAERPKRIAELRAKIESWSALHPKDGLRHLEPRQGYLLPEDFNLFEERDL